MEQIDMKELLNLSDADPIRAYVKGTGRPEWGPKLRELIPAHMRQGIVYYILFGIEPGGFLSSVLRNDMMGAIQKADSINVERLRDYASFLFNYAPIGCFGSPEKFHNWCKAGGLIGGRETRQQKEKENEG